MEFLLEILMELVFQVVGPLLIDVLFDVGFRRLREAARRPVHPGLAAVGYAVAGALAGGVTLLVLPDRALHSQAARIANLVVTPLLAGAALAGWSAWRPRRAPPRKSSHRFAQGYVFALALAAVRFAAAG